MQILTPTQERHRWTYRLRSEWTADQLQASVLVICARKTQAALHWKDEAIVFEYARRIRNSPMTLSLIASQLRLMRTELQQSNDAPDERDRLRDEYAEEQREDRELFDRIRWGAPGQRNNPNNPNWE